MAEHFEKVMLLFSSKLHSNFLVRGPSQFGGVNSV